MVDGVVDIHVVEIGPGPADREHAVGHLVEVLLGARLLGFEGEGIELYNQLSVDMDISEWALEGVVSRKATSSLSNNKPYKMMPDETASIASSDRKKML